MARVLTNDPYHIIAGDFKATFQQGGKMHSGKALALYPYQGVLWVECYAKTCVGHCGGLTDYGYGPHCYSVPYEKITWHNMAPGGPGWAEKWGVSCGDKPFNLSINGYALKSQKAKGVYQLTHAPYGFDYFKKPKAKFYPYELPEFPTFARPCPTVPRHGFVDSRLVHNQDEFNGIVEEIKATGEPIEIICMDYLEPDYSGVFTPSGITFGLGNAGATSGTSAKHIPFDTLPARIYDLFDTTYSAVGIKPPDVPYGEFVGKYGGLKPTVVQLRGGPAVSGSGRYVPQDVTITQVVVAGGDLLDWERKASEFPTGTVVWHPKGALSSHYAVHCILHHIPVVCDIQPKVGDTLKAETTVRELNSQDYLDLAQYLSASISLPIKEANTDLLKMAVGALHASPLWGNEQHLLVMRAEGIAKLFRYAAAAVFGELRHYECGHGPCGTRRTPVTWQNCDHYSRDFVFKQIYRHNIRAVLEALPLVVDDYAQRGWSGAYGGQKWEDCAIAVLRLGTAIQAFLHKKNTKAWKEVMIGWNQTVNAVHNGGGLLTKHLSSHFLDKVAKNPMVGFVSGTVARFVLESESYPRNLKPGKVLPLRPKKLALELYPFGDQVPGFKTVVKQVRDLNGTFRGTVCKGEKKYTVKLPYVTTTTSGEEGLSLTMYEYKTQEFAEVKEGDCTAYISDGKIKKLVQNGKTVVVGKE